MDTPWAEGLIGYIKDRRKQLQDWEAAPPHSFGWMIFGMLVLELTLSRRLFFQLGIGVPALSQAMGTALLLILVQGLLTKAAADASLYFHKKGSWKTMFTFLNIGLFPMLLFLPLTLAGWAMGWGGAFRLVLFLLLALKVFANWRETLEITYEFNKLQSVIILYVTTGILVFGMVALFYLSFFKFLSDFLSVLN